MSELKTVENITYTKETLPLSWKCEPLNLNEEEVAEAFKNVKFFTPSYEFSGLKIDKPKNNNSNRL